MIKNKLIYPLVLCIFLLNVATLFAVDDNMSTRLFYNVSVVGQVKNPGIFKLPPTSRISDAIKYANIAPDTLVKRNTGMNEEMVQPSQRNIILKRNGNEKRIDLLKFLVLGNEEGNPYVKDGDIIVVPPLRDVVELFGAITEPGTYELIAGDRIIDIIELAGGVCNHTYLNKSEVTRFNGETSEIEVIGVNLRQVLGDPDCEDNLLLMDDDRIFFRTIPDFHEDISVYVRGKVKFPGEYPIEEGMTSLQEILEIAGGPTKYGDLENAYLRRRSYEDIIDPEFERLKKVPVDEMTDMEYEYFKTKSREMRGKYSVNLKKLWFDKDKKNNIILKNNDYIYIPDKSATVTVSGHVKSPGLVSYVPNKNYLFYINEADGYAWKARKSKIRIIRASTGEWLKPDESTVIDIGDMIFIPEKPEYDYWQIAQDVLKAMGEVATVLIVIQNIK